MQLGKSLVGGIIGAALGIGLLVAIYLLFGLDHVGLAVPVAILTGLGVRTMVSTSGHASYARGAITGLLALAAYVGGWYLVADLATRRAKAAPKPPTPNVAAADSPDAGETSDAPVVEAPPVQERAPVRANPSGAATRKAVAPGQNPMDYIWLGIAALVAYELGRGTAAKRVEVVGEETVTTVNVHPDA